MTILQAHRVQDLRGRVTREILLPGDDACEDARRIWNAMIDKRPALIVRCAGTCSA